MQRTGFLALLLATIAVVVAVIATSVGGGAAVDRVAGEPVFPALAGKIGDVSALTISRGKTGFTVKREKDLWVVVEKGNYPADGAKLRQSLLGLAELTLVEPKTARPEMFGRLDVEDPAGETAKSMLVTAKDGSGAVLASLVVGKRRPDRLGTGSDGVYLRKAGENQSWLARGTLDPPAEAKDWLEKRIADIPTARVKQVVLTDPSGAKLVIERASVDAKFELVDPPADAKLKAEGVIAEPGAALEALDLADVAPAATIEDPATGGAGAAFTTFDGLVVRAALIDRETTTWVKFTVEGSGEAAKEAGELQARLGPWAYALPAWKLSVFKKKIADFIEPAKAS